VRIRLGRVLRRRRGWRPECIVPGLATPVKLLGLKVWPIEVDLKFLEPVGRELKAIGKFMESAVNLMNASFQDR
ncbi:uncharacterized protein A4U43_C07F28780, partial [Asparagus officinalis]